MSHNDDNMPKFSTVETDVIRPAPRRARTLLSTPVEQSISATFISLNSTARSSLQRLSRSSQRRRREYDHGLEDEEAHLRMKRKKMIHDAEELVAREAAEAMEAAKKLKEKKVRSTCVAFKSDTYVHCRTCRRSRSMISLSSCPI